MAFDVFQPSSWILPLRLLLQGARLRGLHERNNGRKEKHTSEALHLIPS